MMTLEAFDDFADALAAANPDLTDDQLGAAAAFIGDTPMLSEDGKKVLWEQRWLNWVE